ncbi:MAG TPA: patatin-like phospholipase family protein, partial [Bacteroidota bacterium]
PFQLVFLVSVGSAQDGARVPLRSGHVVPDYVELKDNFPNFVRQKSTKRPSVALVLSGGGARGIAAIGVLQSLEEHHIPVDLVVGTSMGSIVGGLYASGDTPTELRRLVDTTVWEDVISYSDESERRDLFLDQKAREERSFLTVRFRGLEPIIPSAFSTGQRLTNLLNLLSLQTLYHPDPSFDDLEIPFRAVSTDLVSGKQIVLDKGDLSEAMRASMTVPLLFTPVNKDSMQLVDGGLIANIPVDVARTLGADIVIAFDATSPLRPKALLTQFWEVGDQIMGIMMQASNREQLAKADVVIRPYLRGHLSSDFSRLDSVIAIGKATTDSVIGRIEAKISGSRVPDSSSVQSLVNPRFEPASVSPDNPETVTPRQFTAAKKISRSDLQRYVNDLYGSGDFESVDATVDEFSDSTLIRVSAIKYPVLDSLAVRGNVLMPTESILALFQPLLHKHINAPESRRALQDVLRLYRDRGFSLARYRSVRFSPVTGVAELDIDEGEIYRMDIRGTQKTRDYVIWRELPFGRRDIFQISKVAQGIRNLNGTNLFEQVSVATHKEGENNVVDIKVKERSTELLRLGLRIDNERNIQPSVDIRDDNFLGIGSELGAGYYGGLLNRNYYGEFKATRIFNSYLTFDLKSYYKLYDYFTYDYAPAHDDVHWSRYRTGEYREERTGVSADFGTQLERLGTMTIEGRVENQRLWNTSGTPLSGTQQFGISSIKVATMLDTKDKYPFPTDGVLMNLSYESALVKVIEAVGFTKFFFSYEFYQTAFGTQTFHPKILVGFADATIPFTEQFSLGGQNNFFGLAENDSRGGQIFVTSFEYQWRLPFKIFFDTYLKARYDLGSIWSTPQAIRLVDLRHGIGATIGLDTPIGPAEFSVGKSFFTRTDILHKPVSYGPFVTYFSIGFAL